ncbi:5-carboxymethyl-2-hydroxymuconate Delta-isomerase [Rhizobium paknamense]|uniref:5-carboxymethyl-2-hydroxymuconate isomerase n=1 Tax=Rhizobium paknamense TaxID=1206817 RepID=A0ABU0IH84_9HYPH|nr:5-carboxymethyl-2-hydroxymuconate Delta-isomerase [Rhizobium paknamense]MDQ0457620.1 5-carboxymethyl-2-hydroxymuconate isomerase [Rhizobium paknamense]
MPHFTFDYSANLEGVVDMRALSRLIHETMMQTELFELGAVRVRGFRTDVYAVADLLAENAFIDMSLRIGKGRSDADKKRVGETIFAAVSAFLSERFETPHFMLSLEIREIDAELSWKKNAIHPRLRQKAI